MQEKTVYSGDPVAMAHRWADEGAQILHVVDLDGAVSGQQVNTDAVAEIVKAIDVPVELGGGLRTIGDIRHVLDIGVRYALMALLWGKKTGVCPVGPAVKPGDSLLGEAFAPLPNSVARAAQLARDCGIGHSLSRQEHNLAASHLPVGGSPFAHRLFQVFTFGIS